MPEKYIRLVKDICNQCETVVRCAAGTSEPFAVEVGHHQGSSFSHFLFAIMMDSLTENIREKTPWQMMLADDVVLCAREKDELELELEQWREAMEKRGMKVSRAKTEYMYLNGTPLGSVNMQSAQLPQVTEFKYLGSTLQSDGGTSTAITKRTQCGWNNWRKVSGVLCDKRVPPHVKGKIHKMIVQPAMLYGMEKEPATISNVKKLEVTEMKTCRWACGHTLRDHVRNENIKERLKVESIAERCRKARLRWFGHVKRRDQYYVGRQTLEMVPAGRRTLG